MFRTLRPVMAIAVQALIVATGVARAETAPQNPYQPLWEQTRSRLQGMLGDPRAAGAMAEVLSFDGRVEDSLVDDALEAVVASREVHPLVWAQAAHELALRLDDRAQSKRADQLRQQLGVLDAFWVVGPFDVQGRAGLNEVGAPETQPPNPRDQRGFDGRIPGEAVSWRKADGVVRGGALLLDALLRPDSNVAGYALTYVSSPRRQRAVLRVGSAGPIKIWCNGRMIHSRDVVRSARPDQDAVWIDLQAGDNALLIKSVITAGAWRLTMRVTDNDGRALAGVRATHTPGRALVRWSVPDDRKRKSVPVKPPRTLVNLLRADPADGNRTGGPNPAKPGAQPAQHSWDVDLDRARYLSYLDADDEEARVPETAARAAIDAGADDFDAWWVMADAAIKDNEERAALERALQHARDPARSCLVLSRLAQLASEAQRLERALRFQDQALRENPDCWPAEMARLQEQRMVGLDAASLSHLQRLQKKFPVPVVQDALLGALQSAGRVDEAAEILRPLLARKPDDTGLLRSAATLARSRGDVAAAIEIFRRTIGLRPDMLFAALDLAGSLEGRANAPDVDEARAVLSAAAARLPGDPGIPEALGRMEARQGQLEPAITALSRALVLRPQNPGLRRYLDRLRAEQAGLVDRGDLGSDLARDYAVNAEDLARTALAKVDEHPPFAARVLLNRQVVRVHENGLSELFAQRVVQVLTDSGARSNEQFQVQYVPGQQEVDVRRARIFRRTADGEMEVSEAAGRDDVDLSEPWYGLYYDNRADVISFDGLRAGDVLEVQYTLADVAFRNEMAGYFGDLQFVAEQVPVDRWDYVLIAPRSRQFHMHVPEMAGFEQTTEESGKEVIHRFSARDVARIKREPSMPGWAEVTPFVHVSTYRDWDEVGAWYWKLVAEQLTPDDAVVRAARQAVQGARDLKEKVQAIHKYVIAQTRYVGLEFGIHGYKPYKVSQVLARRFGDCKDKASLLVAMLTEVGVEAQMVLLRTRRGGDIDTHPASLAVFDHAIAYVPALDVYLDGTAEFSGMAELPDQDQGVMGLRVGPGGAQLVKTPVLPSQNNRVVRDWKVALTAEGGAEIEEAVTITGQAAPEWRSHYQTPGERVERFDKVWSARYPGSAVTALTIEGTDDVNSPVRTQATVTVPQLALLQNGRMTLPVSARPPQFLQSYARLSRRTHDLILSFPWLHEEVLDYDVPEGWRIVQLPQIRQDETGFGRFLLDVSANQGGNAVRVKTLLDVKLHRFTPEDYPQLRAFLSQVELALRERVVLERIPNP